MKCKKNVAMEKVERSETVMTIDSRAVVNIVFLGNLAIRCRI